MATEWLDIVDTAIKIGLGAAISGVSTYIITKSKYSHDKGVSTNATKRELILYATEQADKYFEFTYRYFSALDGIASYCEKHDFNEKAQHEALDILELVDEKTPEARACSYVVISRLSLLGLEECEKNFRNYREGENELRAFGSSISKKPPTKEFLKGWVNKYMPFKYEFHRCIGEKFREII